MKQKLLVLFTVCLLAGLCIGRRTYYPTGDRVYFADSIWVSAPDNPTDGGAIGDIAFDNSYLYVRMSTTAWKRMTLSTWTANRLLLETGDYLLLETGDKILKE